MAWEADLNALKKEPQKWCSPTPEHLSQLNNTNHHSLSLHSTAQTGLALFIRRLSLRLGNIPTDPRCQADIEYIHLTLQHADRLCQLTQFIRLLGRQDRENVFIGSQPRYWVCLEQGPDFERRLVIRVGPVVEIDRHHPCDVLFEIVQVVDDCVCESEVPLDHV